MCKTCPIIILLLFGQISHTFCDGGRRHRRSIVQPCLHVDRGTQTAISAVGTLLCDPLGADRAQLVQEDVFCILDCADGDVQRLCNLAGRDDLLLVVDQEQPDLQQVHPAHAHVGIAGLVPLGDLDPVLLNADDLLLPFGLSGQGEGINLPIPDLPEQTILFQFADCLLDVAVVAAVARGNAEELTHVLQLSAISQVIVRQNCKQGEDLELVVLTAEPVVFKLGVFIHVLMIHR